MIDREHEEEVERNDTQKGKVIARNLHIFFLRTEEE
jgi:hypothetical protein